MLRLFYLHLFQNRNRILNAFQTNISPNDLHAFKQRRADLLSCRSNTQDAKDLIGVETAFFDVCPQGRLASFVADVWLRCQNLIRPLSDLCRLLGIQSLGDELFGQWRHFIFEEEGSKGNAVIQRGETLANKRNNFQ